MEAPEEETTLFSAKGKLQQSPLIGLIASVKICRYRANVLLRVSDDNGVQS